MPSSNRCNLGDPERQNLPFKMKDLECRWQRGFLNARKQNRFSAQAQFRLVRLPQVSFCRPDPRCGSQGTARRASWRA
jgi:hypothetical protein